MKKVPLITLLFLSLQSLQAQYFSGEIHYHITIIPKSDSYIDEEEIDDSWIHYLVDGDFYKYTHFKNNRYYYSSIYDADAKRIFDDFLDKPYITYEDAEKIETVKYRSSIYRNLSEKVLDFSCFKVIRTTSSHTITSYYSSDIRINYANYYGHEANNLYRNLKEVRGALPLKIVTEYETHIEIQEAEEIIERRLKPLELKLPKKPAVAASSALDDPVKLIPLDNNQYDCYRDRKPRFYTVSNKKHPCSVRFMLDEKGNIDYVQAYHKDESMFHDSAKDIIENCQFEFTPGIINGQSVASEVYFSFSFY